MRTPLIAGNWKMNTTVEEAAALVSAMLPGLTTVAGVEKLLCPPFVSLARVKELVAGTTVMVGAQNLFYEAKGAYTGEVSAPMLAALCTHVIIGHSERRQYFGETDKIVNRKLGAAIGAGLLPILCIGETSQENEAGKTREVLGTQLASGLAGLDITADFIIAYEPVWAIGTGRAATAEVANDTTGFIRTELARLFGTGVSEGARILYGGSVDGANIGEYMMQPEIDGALVGGASLKPAEFVDIVKQAARPKGN